LIDFKQVIKLGNEKDLKNIIMDHGSDRKEKSTVREPKVKLKSF
jgi:hypothetical protein